MIQYGAFPVSFILEKVSSDIAKRCRLKKFNVRVGSLRLQVFKEKGTKCISCGKEGRIFILESSSKKDTNPHLNLYGFYPNGHLFLMTKDHIIPKCKGGTDELNNLQPMCFKCNNEKDDNIVSKITNFKT